MPEDNLNQVHAGVEEVTQVDTEVIITVEVHSIVIHKVEIP